jgi:sphingomyelin phosphodiesterase
MKILQLTDIHIDPNYVVGGNAECDEPTCCRFDQGTPENATGAAGYWGDYRDCDLPMHAFQNLIDQASTHTVSFMPQI